jgi:trehalose 6-phosphate phosphatase
MTLDLEPDRNALFLDFDGTLVDIAPRPEAVVVPGDLPDLLIRVAERMGGAVALVSGRPIAELDAFLAPARLPAFGLHGLERRLAGATEQAEAPPSIGEVRAAVAASGLAATGVRVEDKGLSIALHYREAPGLEDAVRELAAALVAPHTDLVILDGKMVQEIKPAFASKATAVRMLSSLPPFAGRRPVYIGDDVTDEEGMRAAIEARGEAVKVGPGPTVAGHRVADPAAVHALLRKILGDTV